MNAAEWGEIYEYCDARLCAGQVGEVLQKMAEIPFNAVPRAWLGRIAHLCLRTGQFSRGLTLLAPVVRPKSGVKADAGEAECAIYALLLIKIGSTDEGMALLEGLRGDIPQTPLHKAFGYQATWDYEAAIPLLRRVADWEGIDLYLKSVAQVNLVASLLATRRIDEARVLLSELLERTSRHGWMMLHMNLQELSGQLAALLDDLDLALRELNASVSSHSHYNFLIDKWKAIVSLRRDPASVELQDGLKRLRERAVEIRHWESVRECDRVLAQATRDEALFLKVFFGTPFPAYRRSLLEESGWLKIPDRFVYGTGPIFDLKSARSADDKIRLKPGQTQHRCLMTLASDLYKPLFVGHLHKGIFADDHFNPNSSPDRVYNVVKRLKQWMEQNGLGLTVETNDLFYRLQWVHDTGLAYTREESGIRPESIHLERLNAAFASRPFTSLEAAKILDLSKSSIVKVLAWGVNEGRLKKSGRNRGTLYSF